MIKIANSNVSPKSKTDIKKGTEVNKFTFASVSDDLEALYLKKKFSDVTFHVGPERTQIYAHRFLLAASSPVLAAMLYPNKCEQLIYDATEPLVIELPDVTPRQFKILLELIYTNQSNVDLTTIDDCLALSRRYCMLNLQRTCLDFLDDELSENNIWDFYDYAPERLGDLDFGLDFIKDNLTQFLTFDNFFRIRPSRLMHLMKQEELRVKESHLFKAIFGWAQIQVEEADDDKDSEDVANYLVYLKPFLPHIRFPLFSIVDFINLVANKGFLEEDEELELLSYIAAKEIRPRIDADKLPKTKWNTSPRCEGGGFVFKWDKHGNASVIKNEGRVHSSIRSSYSCSLGNEPMYPNSGKYYWEIKIVHCQSGSWNCGVGIGTSGLDLNGYISKTAFGWAYMHQGCRAHQSGSSSDKYGQPYQSGAIIGTLYDSDAGDLYFYQNGKNLGKCYGNINAVVYPASHCNANAVVEIMEDVSLPDDF